MEVAHFNQPLFTVTPPLFNAFLVGHCCYIYRIPLPSAATRRAYNLVLMITRLQRIHFLRRRNERWLGWGANKTIQVATDSIYVSHNTIQTMITTDSMVKQVHGTNNRDSELAQSDARPDGNGLDGRENSNSKMEIHSMRSLNISFMAKVLQKAIAALCQAQSGNLA